MVANYRPLSNGLGEKVLSHTAPDDAYTHACIRLETEVPGSTSYLTTYLVLEWKLCNELLRLRKLTDILQATIVEFTNTYCLVL